MEDRMNRIASIVACLALPALLLKGGCGKESSREAGGLSGTVSVDSSSTVFPITEAVAEEFQRAAENKIGFIEMPVAFDGISVLVNPRNDIVDYLSVEELRKIWQPGSTVHKWSDVRRGWPDRPINPYGPGTDSGTFDCFTKAVNIAERAAFLAAHDALPEVGDLQSMAEGVRIMVCTSLDALTHTDSKPARDVLTMDDDIDDANREMFDRLLKVVREQPEAAERALHLVSTSRHLERIADHSSNIAEDVIYMVEGVLVRHNL